MDAASGCFGTWVHSVRMILARAITRRTRQQQQQCRDTVCVHLQGPVPAAFGGMPQLRRLDLSHNHYSGGLSDFSQAVPDGSVLQWLDLSHNKITDGLFGPALARLACFSSSTNPAISEFDLYSEHIFSLANNKLEGSVPVGLINAYIQQLENEVELQFDLRGNGFVCPAFTDEQEFLLGSSDRLDMLGCGGGESGGGAVRAVVGVLVALIVLGAAAALFVLYKRRSRKGWYRDSGMNASTYVDRAEASRLNASNGWFTGKGDDKQFAAGLDEPTGNGSSWGFMPFLGRGGQPVSSLLGGWSRADGQENGAGFSSMQSQPSGGLQLPVSGARALQIKTAASGGAPGAGGKPGAAVTSVELASPMSDLSAGSLEGDTGGAGLDVDDRSELSSEGDQQRNMRLTFNAAYAPVEQS